MTGGQEVVATWICAACFARNTFSENRCRRCRQARKDRETTVMSRWLSDPPILSYERQQVTGVSDKEDHTFSERLSERLRERFNEIEDSTATSRLSRSTAATSIDEYLVKFEASTVKHQLPPATSDLDNDRRDEIEASVADQDLPYIVNELIRRSTLSLTYRGLTWDHETIENASSVLSSSLNTFADKLDKSGSQLGLQAVAFIRKHRLRLIEDFAKTCSSLRWMEMHEIIDGYCSYEARIADWRIEDRLFRRIFDTAAWQWLISRITQQITSSSPEPSIMDVIKENVQTTLSQSNSIDSQHYSHDVTFKVEWDPIAFIIEQGYEQSPQEAIAKAITLTGTATEARAVESAQYIEEIWPFSGESVMRLVQGVVSGRLDLPSYKLDDDTSLRGSMDGSIFLVHVVGTESSVVEVAEQLAWLGAALSTSPYERDIATCTPLISCFTSSNTDKRGHDLGNQIEKPTVKARFDLSFHFDRLSVDATDFNGQCWQKLFLNPVLVRGYPISSRPKGVKGLELPLDVMATLLQASRVTRFGAIPFIKGFSALAFPTQIEKGIILWHLVINEDKEQRISYNDSRIPRSRNLEQIYDMTLESSRHILGWCSHVKNLTGTPTASHPVRYCGLRRPYPGCVLEKVTIGGGKFITASVTAAIGKRDKGILTKSRDSYLSQLMWVADQHVLLFDVKDRRAWLVDGASALLHLVRASIKHLQEHNEFGRYCLFTWDQFKEAAEQVSGKQAAVFVLANEENIQLKLFKRRSEQWQEETIDPSGKSSVVTKIKQTFFRFSDKVEQIFQILEEIVEHQTAAAGEDGVKFSKLSPRRRLEGFDFADLVEDRDPLYPNVYDLHDSGKGWVDFVRAVHATTLFGNGFGELIRPVDPVGLCRSWVEVPKGKNYLAVSVAIMTKLLQRGDQNKVPWQIVDDIYWHSPDKTFEACQCGDASSCDRVQVLVPSGFRTRWGRGLSSPTHLEDKGALIFGNSRSFPLLWGDHGDPARKVIRGKRREREGENDGHEDGDPATPHHSVGSKIASSLTNQGGVNAGKNASTETDVPARNILIEEVVMTSYPRVRLQSFRQMLREACRFNDR